MKKSFCRYIHTKTSKKENVDLKFKWGEKREKKKGNEHKPTYQ